MKEKSADAGFEQSIYRRIIVCRRAIPVAPVHEGCCPAVHLVQRTHQVRDVQVVRLEYLGQSGVHLLEVFKQSPVRCDAAQRGLPCVHVGVDETRNHDAVRGIYDFGILFGDTAAGLDCGDPVIFDEQIR